MKFGYLAIGFLCVVCLAVMPAQAFTAKTLTISLDQNGNAQADMQYDLSFAEQAAIFFHAADPATLLQNALQENLNRPVTVGKADMSSADVTIGSFAEVSTNAGTTTYDDPDVLFCRCTKSGKERVVCPSDFG